MSGKKSNKRLILIISIIIVLAVLAVAWVISSGNNSIVSVTTSEVDRRTITQTVSAIGRIEPETEVAISSETSGEIIYLGVKEGDSVKTGELLVKIKPDIIETQLEASKAASEASKMEIEIRKAEMERSGADLKRLTELYKKEFISKQDFDRAKAAYDQAVSSYKASLSRYEQSKASFRQIERSAERTTIFAPIEGIVTSLSMEKGEKVVGTEMMQGTEIMKISDLSVMNAVVDVDENDIVMVNIGDTAKIEIDAFQDSVFIGTVVEIGHSAKVSGLGSQDQVTNFEVKIRLVNPAARLRPGMSCSVEIETETRYEVLAVPLQAVTVREKSSPDVNNKERGFSKADEENENLKKQRPPSVVFLKDKNKVKQIEVKTGVSDDGYIEITDGLKEKDVIVSGSFMAISKELKDGSQIQVDSVRRKYGNKTK